MKIKFGEYELNITGKQTYEEKNNDMAVLYFLNELSIVYGDAARFNGGNGLQGFEKDFSNKSDALYNIVAEHGGYSK